MLIYTSYLLDREQVVFALNLDSIHFISELFLKISPTWINLLCACSISLEETLSASIGGIAMPIVTYSNK